MDEKTISRVRQKVSLAILVIDDFTNKIIIESSIFITIQGEKKPIRKDDGYYIFLDLMKSKYNIKAGGIIYGEQEIEVDLSKDLFSIIKIRLFPNRDYPISKGTTCIEGIAEPNSQIRLLWDSENNEFKLMDDYSLEDEKNNRKIAIHHISKAELTGKLFYIESKDSKEKEFFLVEEVLNKENKEYLISDKLSKGYKKAGAKLRAVCVTIADNKGDFFMPIANINKSCKCICEAIGGKKVIKEFNISAGKINYVNLKN